MTTLSKSKFMEGLKCLRLLWIQMRNALIGVNLIRAKWNQKNEQY